MKRHITMGRFGTDFTMAIIQEKQQNFLFEIECSFITTASVSAHLQELYLPTQRPASSARFVPDRARRAVAMAPSVIDRRYLIQHYFCYRFELENNHVLALSDV